MNWKKTILSIFIIISCICYGQDTDTDISKQSDTLKNENIAYVIFEYDTLFPIYSNLGPYSPTERATSIKNKIELIAKNHSFSLDSFNIVDIDAFAIINYGNHMIMGISNEEARLAGYNKAYLAENYREIIAESIKTHILDGSQQGWFKRTSFTVMLLLGLFILIYLVYKFFNWLHIKLDHFENNLSDPYYYIFRYLAPKGPEKFFKFLSNLIEFSVIIILLILYLPLFGYYLPWARIITGRFFNFLASKSRFILNSFWDFLPNLIYVIIIYLVARYVVKVITHLASAIEKNQIKISGFHSNNANTILIILKVVIYAFALIFIIPHLPGSGSTAFLGIFIFFGLLLAMGSVSIVANIIAGLAIAYQRPFTIGDRIKVGDTVGDVTEKSLLAITLRTLKNENVTIPNATIMNAHLWNYSKNAKDLGIILHTSVAIGFDEPWEKINQLLLEAAKRTSLLSKDNQPFVLHKGLNDNYVEYELNVYTNQPKKMVQIYSDMHAQIMDVFREANVEILSPRYISTRDGDPSTVPPDYTPDTRNPIEKVIDKISGKEAV